MEYAGEGGQRREREGQGRRRQVANQQREEGEGGDDVEEVTKDDS